MKTKLGQLLIKSNIITQDQLETALKEQKSNELLGETLMRLGYVNEEDIILPFLAEQIGVNYVSLKKVLINPEAIRKIPAKVAYYYKIMPVEYKDNELTIALRNPLDIQVIDGVAQASGARVKIILASEKDILDSLRKYYGVGAETIEQIMDTVDVPSRPSSSAAVEDVGSEASISKFVNQILIEAYQQRATDIHIEPFENELSIRYRVDGILYDANVPENIKYFRDAINSRIKILSNLNIAEKRLPQDGRFKLKVHDIDLDLRVSFVPTQFGESLVIRILSSRKLYSLEELGLPARELKLLDQLIKKPHGIILVTGPTGSGKTTTLYACLSRINKSDRKIITIEDPIEYQLRGITQTQVNPMIGYSFASGLRSLLRHDPDIMMVGEIRDVETAEITIQVALTGHLVFSTLHTNDAASGITRLLDMGIEAFLIASSVECFIAQRLIRVICRKCKMPDKTTSEIIQEFGLTSEESQNLIIYKGEGCEACQFTGFHGRQGIYEFLTVNDDIREMIMTHATAAQIRTKAIKNGMQSLRQDGWNRVKQGTTTPSEVMRVTQDEF